MFKRIGNMLAKDLLYSIRESILVYSVSAMLVLAVGTLLFLPSLEQMEATIAVDNSVPPEVVRELEAYGRVEQYASYESLQERVLAFDDVPGIYFSGGDYVVLLEGNEEDYILALPGVILDYILMEKKVVDLSTISLGRERSPVREYTAMFFLMSMFLIGGMFIGLSIIDDRQSGTIRALAVSPINVLEYMIAKSALGLVLVVASSLVVATILLGPAGINYPLLLIWIVSSLGVTILIGFLIGLISNNVIAAIAMIKVMALFIVGVTLAFLFMPDHLKWLLYIFPNYWSVEGFNRLFIQTDLPLVPVNLAAAVINFGLVLILVFRFGRKLRLTVRGGE